MVFSAPGWLRTRFRRTETRAACWVGATEYHAALRLLNGWLFTARSSTFTPERDSFLESHPRILVRISSFLDRFTRGGRARQAERKLGLTVPVRGFPAVKFEEAVI
jgi:hypothetical protein